MLYNKLGNTGINVSRICFGALGLGPLQANLPIKNGAAIIAYAFEKGINFIDTAELYQTYPYIKAAMGTSYQDVVIATKSYAYSREMMQQSFDKARIELNRDYIDIFMLHEQESAFTIKGHWQALEFLLEMKQKGCIKAVGISTHHVAAVEAAVSIPEIEIIHPLINIAGLGIADGSRIDMETSIAKAINAGKGIYCMKALGGGNLIHSAEQALNYAYSLPTHAVAIGMKSFSEVDFNLSLLLEGTVEDNIRSSVASHPRSLLIEDWCQACGKCIKRCSQGALELTSEGIQIDKAKCILCGYCASACLDFCIKIV